MPNNGCRLSSARVDSCNPVAIVRLVRLREQVLGLHPVDLSLNRHINTKLSQVGLVRVYLIAHEAAMIGARCLKGIACLRQVRGLAQDYDMLYLTRLLCNTERILDVLLARRWKRARMRQMHQ